MAAHFDVDVFATRLNFYRDGADWMPGDFGTLRIAEKGTQQFFSLQEGEIWNGRIAMIAIFAYVVQEALTGFPTANTIPFFLPALP